MRESILDETYVFQLCVYAPPVSVLQPHVLIGRVVLDSDERYFQSPMVCYEIMCENQHEADDRSMDVRTNQTEFRLDFLWGFTYLTNSAGFPSTETGNTLSRRPFGG